MCVGFTSFSFVLLELLIDGSDGIQQHLDLLHAGEEPDQRHTHSHRRIHAWAHVQALLSVLGMRSHLLRPAVCQQTSREELGLNVLSGSFHRLQ